jgi:hypothetical protein
MVLEEIFAIFDERAYMVQIFHNENEPPSQALFSNSKGFVEKQQVIFNKLWSIAIPLSIRKKELEHDDKLNYRNIVIDYDGIQNEIFLLLEQSRKELLIISSTIILQNFFDKNNLLKNILPLLKREVTIKIIIDNIDENIISQIKTINNENKNKPIQFGFTNKLGNFTELIIINDSKCVFQLKYDKEKN